LRDRELGPLYFVYGKERFLVDRAVELIKQRVLDPRTRDFNYEQFQGKEVDAGRVVQAARTLPMMAKRRMVLLRDADEMKADQLALLIPYVSSPAAETCLVLTGEKADQRLKIFGAWKKHGQLVKLDPLYERQLPGFVREEGRARGVRFEPGAAERLCDEIGADLGQLADAVERLAIFTGGPGGAERAVAVKDVEECIASTRQRSVFELAEAVGEGNRARALVVLEAMIGARESGVRIVAMLARHVRQLWMAYQLGRRASKAEVAAALGIPPFFVDGIVAQARRLDRAALERMHDALYRTDVALKSSRLDDGRVLERLVLELTQPRAAAAFR
jgi:DNA polymerase-3 subunit delta